MDIDRRKRIVIGGSLVAGTAIVVGGAFTAGGVTDSSGDGFIGGQEMVAITGATITNIDFELTGDDIDQVTVQFDPADNVIGRTLEVVFADGTSTPITNGTSYTCTTIYDADAGAPVLPQSECTSGTEVQSPDVERVLFTVEN